jgi:hypothetical protein
MYMIQFERRLTAGNRIAISAAVLVLAVVGLSALVSMRKGAPAASENAPIKAASSPDHSRVVVQAGSTTITFDPVVYRYTKIEDVDVARVLRGEHDFDISEDRLDSSLATLFDGSHIPVVAPEDTQEFRASAVKGHLALNAALTKLLAGTPCRFEVVNNDVLEVWCKQYYPLVRRTS